MVRAIKRLQLPDPHPESAPIPPKLYKALYAKAKNALKPQPIHKAKKAGHEDLSSQLKREVNVICTKLGGTTIADAVLKTSIWACERKESRKTDADRPAVLSAVYLLVATYCKEQQRLEKEQQKLHKERQKREQQIIHGEQSREQSGDDSTPVKPKSQQAAASTSSAPQKIGKKEKSRVLATLEGQVEDFKLDRWIEIIESEIREDDYFLILYPPKPVRTPKKAAIEPDTVHKEDTEDSVMATPSKRKAVYELPNPRIMPCQVTFSGVGSMVSQTCMQFYFEYTYCKSSSMPSLIIYRKRECWRMRSGNGGSLRD